MNNDKGKEGIELYGTMRWESVHRAGRSRTALESLTMTTV